MRICLICVQIFSWGKYGGFGRATRLIGRELVKRGHEVFAVVPRRPGQNPIEMLDGITVYGFSPYFPWSAGKWLKQANADIYHSCEPSLATLQAIRAMPDRKHMVTIRDPRDSKDWKMEYRSPSLHKLQVTLNYFYENNRWVRDSISKMGAVYTTGEFLIPKVRSIYNLPEDPGFLPTPVDIPIKTQKANGPTVCYVARLDRRKRPTLFFDLAKKFPDVNFIAIGTSRDKKWEKYLRETYSNIPNLEMMGFVDQFSSSLHSTVLEKSWVMVNTSIRESLPNAFLEAAAHRCSILSAVNPDGFASQFGYHAVKDDFEAGLSFLLEKGRWKERGIRGYQYVKNTFEMSKAINRHEEAYVNLLQGQMERRESK